MGNVVARLDFKAAAEEGRLPSAVGSLLRLDGFSALVHWLDGSERTVRLEEVCSFSLLNKLWVLDGTESMVCLDEVCSASNNNSRTYRLH